MSHRQIVYAGLSGHGLDIGALHEPARLPAATRVTYFDARSKAESIRLFPELAAKQLVDPDVVGNLDVDGLRAFGDATFDFVIISHVIEHLANPLLALREVFRVAKVRGFVVIAVPDKDYTFDRLRPTVTWEHLVHDYADSPATNSDDHYVEFLRSAHAERFPSMAADLAAHVAHARQRCEHAHAWDSKTFRRHLVQALGKLGYSARGVMEWSGLQTQQEYFGLWQRIR